MVNILRTHDATSRKKERLQSIFHLLFKKTSMALNKEDKGAVTP